MEAKYRITLCNSWRSGGCANTEDHEGHIAVIDGHLHVSKVVNDSELPPAIRTELILSPGQWLRVDLIPESEDYAYSSYHLNRNQNSLSSNNRGVSMSGMNASMSVPRYARTGTALR